jgi:hypothetical protein
VPAPAFLILQAGARAGKSVFLSRPAMRWIRIDGGMELSASPGLMFSVRDAEMSETWRAASPQLLHSPGRAATMSLVAHHPESSAA